MEGNINIIKSRKNKKKTHKYKKKKILPRKEKRRNKSKSTTTKEMLNADKESIARTNIIKPKKL